MAYPYAKISEMEYAAYIASEIEKHKRTARSEEESFRMLDNIPVQHIEKYLRKKKLEIINK